MHRTADESAVPAGMSAGSVFARIARFALRHRWAVVVFWTVATAAAVALLPSLNSVVRNDNAAFLPPDSPSVVAARLAAPFGTGDQASGTLVVVRPGGALTAADNVAFGRMVDVVRRLPAVRSVEGDAVSPDGSARAVAVGFAPSVAGGGQPAANAVGAIRSATASLAPPGLHVYLTGSLPELVDQQSAARGTASHLQILSIVFIVGLLLVAFRAALAPLVALAPAAVALNLAGPLIAASSRFGVAVSSLMELLLTALVLGAGTDYGLFLLFRYRENLERGLAPGPAVVAAVERVGESITFSALTVIAALLSLLMASFGLYRGVGPGLAIGVAVVLAVDLTLFPALVGILGRGVFWPLRPRPGGPRAGWWGAVAARVSRRPMVALATGVVGLGVLAAFLSAYSPSGFDPGGYIGGSNSALGQEALEAHFGPGVLGSTDLLLRFTAPVWSDPDVLSEAQALLGESRQFSSVAGPTSVLSPGALSDLYRRLGDPGALAPVPPAASAVPPALYDAYRDLAQSISPDGKTVLLRASLRAGPPGSTAAFHAVPAVRATLSSVAGRVGASTSGVAGQAAAAADVSAVSDRDVVRIAPVVMVVLALLLAAVLRSLVAPLYLVASVALSYLASVGLAVAIFVVAGHQIGVNFTLPFFMFVFIMALGEDYNILVMSRIREESRHAPRREAVALAVGRSGTTVTSAGLVLAGTFGILAVATRGQVRQIGTGLAFGILLDTFVVRTLLVPSVAVLLGRWNWWPWPVDREQPPELGGRRTSDPRPSTVDTRQLFGVRIPTRPFP